MEYSYKLEFDGCSWPDAHFDLLFDPALSDERLQVLDDKLGDFINKWNDQVEQNGQDGFIHNMLSAGRIRTVVLPC